MRAWKDLPRWARLTVMAVASRLLALAAMVAGTYFPRPDDDLHWIGNDGHFFWDQLPVRVLDVWGRWDTMYYWSIARFGYPGPNGGWVYHAAYYPLFPSMMRGLSVLTGLEPYLAGVVLAFTLYGLAFHYFDRLVQLDGSPEFAERVMLVLVAYPGTHFLTCVYPESTALFLGVFGVYNARLGRTWVAALTCLLAGVVRATGVFVCIAIGLELLRDADTWRLRPRALVAALGLVSLGGWAALNGQLYGDPLYFMHVQQGWGRHPSFPLAPFFSLELSLDHHLIALTALALMVFGWRRRERFSVRVLATLNTLLPLSTGMLRGVHRYMGTNFPLYVFGARFFEGRERWLKLYVVGGLGLMALFAFKWGQGYHPN